MRILSLDLSTTASGWAELEDGTLLEYGVIKPKLEKDQKKARYPVIQLYKMMSLANQILQKCRETNYDYIIIEEINRGKNRLGQKTLDGLHWIVLEKLWGDRQEEKVIYFDSDGAKGWRSKAGLGLQLTAQDKLVNTERRKLNKKLARKQQQPLITQKTLSIKFVNDYYGLSLTDKDNDIADAIGLGHFYIHHVRTI